MPPARHPTLSFGQKKRPPTEPTAVPRSEPKGIFAERFLNGLARGGLLSLSLYITVEDWGMSPNLNPLIPLIPLLLGNRTGLVESTEGRLSVAGLRAQFQFGAHFLFWKSPKTNKRLAYLVLRFQGRNRTRDHKTLKHLSVTPRARCPFITP